MSETDMPRDNATGQFTSTDDLFGQALEKPTGKREQLAAGQDPRRVAWRMTREAHMSRTPDFNRQLHYPNVGAA